LSLFANSDSGFLGWNFRLHFTFDQNCPDKTMSAANDISI
jgi:hypothetical protein